MYRTINLLRWRHVHQSRWLSTVKKIEKILIANRGEIACRVMKTAKRLGVRTVAVYSESDENSMHVALADEAYKIGPSPSVESYLKGHKIIEVAKNTNCQAVHPGYGFLSENVEFAENCQKSGVVFIGPPPSAIRDMGIKSTSKHIMAKAGVPIIEGYHGEDQSLEKLKSEAKRIGFPIMIKAVRGGGGKGMRIANAEEEFEEALESAKSESRKSFGDDVVLLEKFVTEPRHVEVQVFADTHGNAVHLFERDCSVQRRHQKIIEEAPAPGLSDSLRMELGAAAVRAAKAVGYVGAGTVEFILDKKTHSFHFMEMNTRLQVEHPITEMITGTDLVEWQIKVAAGDKLPLTQEEIKCKGHAFEARIYAEDPRGGFLPGAGPLHYLVTPVASQDVRIETGVRQGDEVSVYYDPMIAKLVVWGNDRSEALSKLRARLQEYNICGVETNVNFLLDLTRHPEFEAGNVHTNFIQDYHDSLFIEKTPGDVHLIQAALATVLKERLEEEEVAARKNDKYNPFTVEAAFRINYNHKRKVQLKNNDKDVNILVEFEKDGSFKVSCDEGKNWYLVNANLSTVDTRSVLTCTINDIKHKCDVFKNESTLALFDQHGKTEFLIPPPSYLDELDGKEDSVVLHKAVAPMPGVIDKLLVKIGDTVKEGDSLFVMIAMKMEHVVKASRDAKISNILYGVGDFVPRETTVIQFDEAQ